MLKCTVHYLLRTKQSKGQLSIQQKDIAEERREEETRGDRYLGQRAAKRAESSTSKTEPGKFIHVQYAH